MGRIAVLGDPVQVRGWALAGLLVIAARDKSDVQAAWDGIPDDVELVLLTRAAADVLGDTAETRLSAVLP